MRHASVMAAILLLGALGGCVNQGNGYGSPTASNNTTQAPTPGGSGATTDLAAQKAQLAAQGKYACCIKSPCDLCLRAHGECDCSVDLKKGEGVCAECYGAWKAGQGNVAGVDPATVKQGTAQPN